MESTEWNVLKTYDGTTNQQLDLKRGLYQARIEQIDPSGAPVYSSDGALEFTDDLGQQWQAYPQVFRVNFARKATVRIYGNNNARLTICRAEAPDGLRDVFKTIRLNRRELPGAPSYLFIPWLGAYVQQEGTAIALTTFKSSPAAPGQITLTAGTVYDITVETNQV